MKKNSKVTIKIVEDGEITQYVKSYNKEDGFYLNGKIGNMMIEASRRGEPCNDTKLNSPS